jgi:pimeloyl-ACP methyl ester carboxylesterase
MELVFIHGAGCTGDVFGAQLEAFPAAVALTLPGHTTPGVPTSIATFADFVAAQLEQRSLDDVVLCGHSMGGAIALEVGLRQNPRVAGIVLLGSGAKIRVAPAIFEALDGDFDAATRMLATSSFAKPTSEQFDFLVAMLQRVGKAQTERDFRACDVFDVTARIAGLALPLLALTGEQDVLMPPKSAEWVADRVPGAEARILPDAGHFVMIERPADTNEAVRAFVTEIER